MRYRLQRQARRIATSTRKRSAGQVSISTRRCIKRVVISLYCRGWLSFRATEWVFQHINLREV